MPLMRARLGLAMLLLGLSMTVSAGTLTVDVHASYVDDGSTNGYIGSAGYYSWDRAWWEQETDFSFGVTQVINGSSYWSGTVVSDSWNHYLRSGYVQQGQCYTTDLSVQVFTPDSSYPIDAGNDSDTACVPTYCFLYAWKWADGNISALPQTGRYLCGTTISLYVIEVTPGWQFDGWSGDVNSSDPSITVTLNANKSVWASFSSIPPPPDPGPPDIGDGCNPQCSPIIINFENGGYRLTGANAPVSFDMLGNGHPVLMGWTAAGADEAFLWLDRNHSGRVTNGSQLFGNFTPLLNGHLAKNGFEALAEFDENHDGVIDDHDPIWSQLLL
jgi:hypothetical protein